MNKVILNPTQSKVVFLLAGGVLIKNIGPIIHMSHEGVKDAIRFAKARNGAKTTFELIAMACTRGAHIQRIRKK